MGFVHADIEAIRSRVHEAVADQPETAAAYLFGSAVTGGFRAVADSREADLMERISRAYAEDGYRYRLAVEEILRETSSHET